VSEGYVFAMGTCWNCKQIFSFNPHHVPSLRVNDVREPICRKCIEAANVIRKANNLPPHDIMPDAYEPIPEGDL
jgi:hypothetical protein